MYFASVLSLLAVFSNTVCGQLFGHGSVTDISSKKPTCYSAKNNCLLEPCIMSTCDRFPIAECRNCYTNCSPEYWNGGTEVTSQCSGSTSGTATTNPGTATTNPSDIDLFAILAGSNTASGGVTDPLAILFPDVGPLTPRSQCPTGQTPVTCLAPPCLVSSCPRYPTATCTNNNCGSCTAVYLLNGVSVTSQCGLTQPAVPSTQMGGCSRPTAKCLYNPCKVTACPAFGSRATCLPTNCGGCFARFFYQNREVTGLCRQQQQQSFNPASLFVLPWMDQAFF